MRGTARWRRSILRRLCGWCPTHRRRARASPSRDLDGLNSTPIVWNLLERRQSGRSNDVQEPLAFVKFLAVAIDEDGARRERCQAAELIIDQPEAPHHVLDVLVLAVAHPD